MSERRHLARLLVPQPLRRWLREQHRRYVFARAVRELSKRLPDCDMPERLAADLIYGWNNGWSVTFELIPTLLRCAYEADGPILECGSGLSTVLLGLAAQRTGNRVWSLEHKPEWAQRVRDTLDRFRITSVEVLLGDLFDYGSYTWYAPPLARMPSDFALVVCDGPPGDTAGGRYGLLPTMRSHLKPGCTILLDDATRPKESEALARWSRELGADFTICGVEKPFAKLIVPPGR